MRKDSTLPSYLVAGGALLLMIWAIWATPPYLVADEPMHLHLAQVLRETGSWHQMLFTESPSAPGPIYQAIHAAFYPLTHFEPYSVRVLNFALLLLTLVVTWRTLARIQTPHSFLLSAAALAVPSVWAASGLALTEVPAWLMAACSLWFGVLSVQGKKTSTQWVAAACSGLCLGLAICGRQLLLPMIILTAGLGWMLRGYRWRSTLFILAALPLPCWLFLTWGGLVRPSARMWVSGLEWKHLIWSFGYLTVVIFLISPGWFRQGWRWWLALGTLGFGASMFGGWVHYPPSASLLKVWPWPDSSIWLGRMMGSAFFGLGVSTFGSLLYRLWNNRRDPAMIFFILTVMGLSMVPLANPQLFSTRYVIACFPFLLFLLRPWFHTGPAFALRLFFGASLGAYLLLGYRQ